MEALPFRVQATDQRNWKMREFLSRSLKKEESNFGTMKNQQSFEIPEFLFSLDSFSTQKEKNKTKQEMFSKLFVLVIKKILFWKLELFFSKEFSFMSKPGLNFKCVTFPGFLVSVIIGVLACAICQP